MSLRQFRRILLAGMVAALGSLAVAAPASAQALIHNPGLPPVPGVYVGPGPQVYLTPPSVGFSSNLTDIALSPVAGTIVRTDVGVDEQQQFTATLTGLSDIDISGVGSFADVPISASGPALSVARLKAGHVTGSFETELLSLNISGATALGPFMLRESPTRPSIGHTTITQVGSRYRIDSFFDVFTEVSIDGGQNWIPNAAGASRLTLVPEPSTVALLAIGGACAFAAAIRRRRAAVRN